MLVEKGLHLIAKYEGCVLKLKPDEVSYPTIGYGHKTEKGEIFTGELDAKQAWALLEQDAEDRAAKYVRKYVKPTLYQHQFDALTSFTFNLGCGKLERSVY